MNEPVDPEDQYPLYPRGMLRRHGLLDAHDLADYLPDWSENDLREGFWPGLTAIGGARESIPVLEQSLGLEGGETVLRVRGLPLLLSDDIWNFQALAAPELLRPLAAAMRALRER
ncbi:hypothetical protein J5226_09595 [Lysobacter sp. K5869]|uniref:hypothetical protein n=1 Tax=Lysobacter sp. K5869 TaxID=2820808 RepID=UPI001C05F3D8|nr:hypothetical protein [Lysobacter sp. K5869]QWP78622.1 hypothetical protein J5226_09595 [Lysobacter sp. K5869]